MLHFELVHEGVKVKLNSVDLTEFSYGVLATNTIITTCKTWGLDASDKVYIQTSRGKIVSQSTWELVEFN